MSASMFGTDGMRGTPGEYPLDRRTIVRLAAATVRALGRDEVTVLVARDTRESGPWIEEQLARGITSQRGHPVSVGIMPTPAAAFLAARSGFDAALVISASHNPFPDNGIKLLTGAGEKASLALEARIEKLVSDESWTIEEQTSPSIEARDLVGPYAEHAAALLAEIEAPQIRVVVDCANGATALVAPMVLRQLGFDVVTINDDPNGRNINDGCGSTHPAGLQKAVLNHGGRIGLAFDGDGDRVILVDHRGDLVNGDAMLLICAKSLKARGHLTGDAIVATVMSNVGLEIALRDAGIAMHRCPVGDREVREAMVERRVVLGGEQSGHVIISELLPTGDGLVTALSVIRAMIESGRELADLSAELEVYPQVLVNVPVRSKPDLEAEPEITSAISEAEDALAGRGRVLVRYSGTEPLLRVMIEGCDADIVQRLAGTIAERARQRLG